MQISLRIFFLTLVLLMIIEAAQSLSNDSNSTTDRKGRINGRIVKIYSGSKPDPVICLEEGFRADPVDCSVFYRCTKASKGKYNVYRFRCGPGTVYDPETEICNHPSSTKRSECGGLMQSDMRDDDNDIDGQELPSPINTAFSLYPSQSESNGFESSSTSHFIEKHPNSKPTTPFSYPILTTTEQKYVEHSNNLPTYQLMDLQNESQNIVVPFTTTAPKSENSYPCTSDGFVGDDDDCRKFYRCVSNSQGGFIRYEFSCSESTVWDDNMQSCNHAWAVRSKRCGRDHFNRNSSNQFNKNDGSTFQHKPVQNVSEIKIEEQNFEDNLYDENSSEYGNKLSHKQQSTYNSQEILETETQNKLTENQNLENNKPYLETNKLSHYDTTVSSYPSNIIHENYIIQATGNNRSNDCIQSGFMADSNDCKKFYRCVNNGNGGFTKYEFSCSQQTVWDRSIEACNHAWAVKECGGRLLSETSISTSSFMSPTNISTSTFNYVKEENEYSHINEVNQEQTTYMYPNRLTTVSSIQTTSIKSNQKFDNDSGYNNQQNAFTVPPNIGESETTLKHPQFQRNRCQSSGFMSDTNDCKKFYRCVDNGNGDFTQYEFSCGEGTAWDPEIEACNHAWAIKDCSAGHTLSSTHNVNDVSLKPTNTPGYEVENGYVTQSNIQPGNFITTTTPSSSNFMTDATNNEYKCKSDGFISDKDDCKKFYRCVDDGNGGFTQHEFSCGQGTAWDSKINACNHEWAVENCSTNFGTQLELSSQSQNETQIVMSSSSPVIQIQQTQTSTFSTISTSATQVNHSYSKEHECSSEGFFANPNDCKKFIRCVDDGNGVYTKYNFACGDGTVWVQEIESCDHNTDVNCSDIHNIDTTPKHEVSTSTTNLISSNTEKESEMHKPNNKECVSEGFYPNENDCRNFYRCVDSGDGHYTKYEFSCAEGTAWDVTIGSCNYLSKVNGCKDVQTKPIMQDEQVSESQQDITTSETTTIRPTTSKSTTHMETSSKSTTTRTTFKSTTSMETTSKPTTSKSTTEYAKPSSEDTCKEDGYYGNSQDCTKFYRCVSNEKGNYTKYDYTCGEGTIWDQDITACNHPGDVTDPSCKSQQEISYTTTSSSTQHTNEGNGNMSETTSSSISTPTSSSNKNETNSNCSNNATESSNDDKKNEITCKKAGFYANPGDCKKFYRCVDWDNNGEKFSIFHFECGEGTIWDPALETCNHENSVYPPRNCNGTQQQNENVTDSTSTTENISSTSVEESTTSTQPITQTTTTHQSTTKPTTIEQTMTQPSTVQESTTQQSTTQQLTQQSTTQQSTTKQSTTQQSTTQQSTTQQSTTQQSMTQQSTTQQSTTQQSTTQQSTTQQPTTQQSITDESTTQQSTESTQTTSQTTQEQTTKSSTEQTTEAMESNTTTSTTQFSDQTTTTDSTTQQLTTTDNTSQTESSTENQTESSTESMSNKECPDTDKDQYLFVCPTSFKRHPKYCNLFYQCTEDNDSHEVKIAVFQCPNNTIYDESKVQCVEENRSDKKCNGQIARKYRVKRLGIENNEPIIITKEKMSCPTSGHFPFTKHEQCSPALLKCELTKSGKLRGYVYRCPEGYVYWSISRRCESLKKLKDCEKPSEAWNRRYDIPIERHNIGH